MITKKIFNFLRGGATPFQIAAGCWLGALLAFNPGYEQAPGLTALLWLLVILINANAFIGGLVFLGAKLLYWACLPLVFELGFWFLEGPLQGFFAQMVNAPVLAWFGLEHYVVSGGLALGSLCGLLTGLVLVRAVQRVRRKFADLEEGSEAFQKYSARKWVKIVAWFVVGSLKPKKGSWREIAEQKRKGLLRPLGLVFAGGLSVLAAVAFFILDSEILTAQAQAGLERVNGASVDLGQAALKGQDQQILLQNLAAADPEKLSRNLIEADSITVVLGGTELLRRKVVIESVAVSGALHGGKRPLPGRLLASSSVYRPEEEEDEEDDDNFGLGKWLKDADAWEKRLATLRRYYEKLSPQDAEATDGQDTEEAQKTDPAELPPTGPSLRERLRQEALASGFEALRSDRLIRRAPRILIREIRIEDLRLDSDDGSDVGDRSLNIIVKDLASPPALHNQPLSLQANSADGELMLAFTAADPARLQPATLEFALLNQPIDSFREKLEDDLSLPLRGGFVDFTGQGTLLGPNLDLPLTATLRDTVVRVGGKDIRVASLQMPLRLHGQLDRPSLELKSSDWQNALKKIAGDQLRDSLQDKADDLLKDKIKDDRLRDTLKKVFPFGG